VSLEELDRLDLTLRLTAAQHFTRATELEKKTELVRSPPTVPEK